MAWDLNGGNSTLKFPRASREFQGPTSTLDARLFLASIPYAVARGCYLLTSSVGPMIAPKRLGPDSTTISCWSRIFPN